MQDVLAAAAVGAVVQMLAAVTAAVVPQLAALVAGQEVGAGKLAKVLPQLLASLPLLPDLLEPLLWEH